MRACDIEIAPHVEFTVVLMVGLKTQPLIQTQRRICFHDTKCHGLPGAIGLGDQASHDFATDALLPKRRVNEKLSEEQCFVFCSALKPADVGTVAGDNSNLDLLPLPAEAFNLLGNIKVEFANGFLHAGEIEESTVVEIFGPRR